MSSNVLEKKIKMVPERYYDEVSAFIDFILYRANNEESETESKKYYRRPGIMKDKIYMSEDFDAPMDDFKEYM